MDKFRKGMLGGAVAVFLGASGSWLLGIGQPNPWILSFGVFSSVILFELNDSIFPNDTNGGKKRKTNES